MQFERYLNPDLFPCRQRAELIPVMSYVGVAGSSAA